MQVNRDKRYYLTSDSFIVVLSSQNATQYINGSKNSSILFDFTDTISKKSFYKMKCSVLTFSSPNSLYTINENNNLLSITINSIITIISVPYGNYNSKTFIATLLTLLPVGFNLTLNTITNLFTMSYTTNFTINSTSTIYDIIGFSLGIVYNSTNSTLTFPFSCNFNGIQSINIHFTNLKTKNIDSYTKSASTIIQSLPVEPGTGMIQYYKTNNYSFDVDDEIEFIQIDLKDNLNNCLNFNNKHWDLTLLFENLAEFDILEKNNNFFSIVENGYSPFNY